uniref:Homeodomain interacting protein kinase 4 n=1 Tax=Pseudonaja textilis TaxID=8673 RepID=A0A670ZRH2_PSETE
GVNYFQNSISKERNTSESDFYDVFEILGKGTFGEVVKSWKRSTGEMVAIKILKNDSYRSRIIKNELKLLQTMSEVDSEESHIVQFHEFFHDELKFYLVFELLEQNLFDFQKEHNFSSLPVRHIRTVTMQVLRALAKLKELSIIHADLKPENIMLVDQVRYPFRVKVIDFGSASIFNEVRYVKEPYIQSRFYRAPEILLGLPFCEKLDMWSLGCVMAELHLGWPLYPGNNEYDQIRYICETQGMPRPSLDQMETVNVHKMIYPDTEALAEYFDLRSMVELIKRMLTWDSHERITPSAGLKHPYISTQPLKQNYSLTQYYQFCLRSLRESLPSHGKASQEELGRNPIRGGPIDLARSVKRRKMMQTLFREPKHPRYRSAFPRALQPLPGPAPPVMLCFSLAARAIRGL